MKIKYYQVVTACSSVAEARRIARVLVELKLAACAQINGPVHSTYWWQGKIEQGREWVCVLKCQAKNYAELEAVIKRMHSYSVPEILAVPVETGNPQYLKWLEAETHLAVFTGGSSYPGKSTELRRRASKSGV